MAQTRSNRDGVDVRPLLEFMLGHETDAGQIAQLQTLLDVPGPVPVGRLSQPVLNMCGRYEAAFTRFREGRL